MKKIIFILMIAVQAGFSYDFENITMAEIRAGAENFKAPVPQNPVTEDDEITADLSMRVPFAAVKKLFVSMSASDGRIKLIDDVAPILYSDGKTLTVKNLKLNINGIMAEPVLSLKLYMEAKNKMALKIEKSKIPCSYASRQIESGVKFAVPNRRRYGSGHVYFNIGNKQNFGR